MTAELIAMKSVLYAAIGGSEHGWLVSVDVIEHFLDVPLRQRLGAFLGARQQLVRVRRVVRQTEKRAGA